MIIHFVQWIFHHLASVILAPNVDNKLRVVCVQTDYWAHLAGLLEADLKFTWNLKTQRFLDF